MSDAELGEVDLIGAKIGDLLVMDGAAVTGTLKLDAVSSEGSLYMRNGEFADVVLRGATIGGHVGMVGAKVAGTLNIDATSTRGGLLMQDGEFAAVNLRGARIGGQMSLKQAQVTGELKFHATSIETALLMTEAEFGNVELVGTTIGNQLSTIGSKFQGDLRMDSSTVGTDLYIRQTRFLGDVSLLFVKVGSNLDLRGAVVNLLDLRGTRIERQLLLANVDHELRWRGCAKDATDADAPRLQLENVTVGVLQDTVNTWPDCVDRELEGFVYERLGGFEESSDETVHERGSDWFIAWLERDQSFSPQPYRQLARVFEASGHVEMAEEVLFAGLERERSELGLERRRWWGLSLLRWTVGYGYGWGYLWTLLWVAFLTGAGTVWLYCSKERDSKGNRLGFWYSFDMLLPVIRLREGHYDVDLATKAKYYFYLHKIFGYVLVSVVIAGITDLAN